MSNHYEHTQPGTLMIVISVVAALVCAAFAYSDTGASRWIAGAVALGMMILAWLFSSLTVIVNDQRRALVLRTGRVELQHGAQRHRIRARGAQQLDQRLRHPRSARAFVSITSPASMPSS